MSEILPASSNFEENKYREIEQKFLPLYPGLLEKFYDTAAPIGQLYLSCPDEPFSLRIRTSIENGQLNHTATLKDRGVITPDGLDRLEISTPVAQQTYEFHRLLDRPDIRKHRAEPTPGVAIDFFADGYILAESEQPEAWQRYIAQYTLEHTFVDVTGQKFADNEWRAHEAYRREHGGAEALTPADKLNVEQIQLDILRHQITAESTLVRIAGRSGSGKTTIVRELQAKLDKVNLPSIVLSTDDYHRGKTWLETFNHGEPWTEWDAPIVYDRAALVEDIATLRQGKTIRQRRFDFASEEPIVGSEISGAPVILIEGIYAGHPDFATADLSYEVATPLATCIGRRILRDLVERPQFADPARSLQYALEQAEPAYQAQQTLTQGEQKVY